MKSDNALRKSLSNKSCLINVFIVVSYTIDVMNDKDQLMNHITDKGIPNIQVKHAKVLLHNHMSSLVINRILLSFVVMLLLYQKSDTNVKPQIQQTREGSYVSFSGSRVLSLIIYYEGKNNN